jgi:hypothetical protein
MQIRFWHWPVHLTVIFEHHCNFLQIFNPSMPFKTPIDRGRRVHFYNDFQGNFPGEYLYGCTIVGLGFLCMVCCSRLGFSRYTKAVWISTVSLQALGGAFSAARYLAQGQDRTATMNAIFHIPLVYWVIAVSLSEKYVVAHLLLQGFMSSACITFNQHVMMGRSLAECAHLVPRRLGVWLNLIFAGGLHADYWQSLRRAHRLLDSDRQRHDAVWARVSSEEAAELQALRTEVNLLAGPVAAQCGRRPVMSSQAMSLRQSTSSLDQLFAQARFHIYFADFETLFLFALISCGAFLSLWTLDTSLSVLAIFFLPFAWKMPCSSCHL